MTLQINMRTGAAANGSSGVGLMTASGNPWTVFDHVARELVNRGVADPYGWPATAGYVAAPATLDSSNGTAYNAGAPLSLASGGTITVADTAWALLTAGLTIQVGQSSSATLAFSGSAVKENSAGTSGSSVTLAASGVYVLTQSPSGWPKYRLTGGASL